MSLKINLDKPKLIEEAKQGKSISPIIQISSFIVVFIVGCLFEMLILGAPMMRFMFGSEEVQTLTKQYSEGTIGIEELTSKIKAFATTGLPDNIVVLSLVATVCVTIASIVYCKRYEKRSLASMGFRKSNAVKEYLIGMLVGFGMFSAAVGICLVLGGLSFDGIEQQIAWHYILLYFVGFVIQGMSEEVACRGYLMISLATRVPMAVALGISSVVFAVLHLGNPGVSPLAVVNLIMFGLFAGIYFLKRGNIWGACAAHSVWNFVQGNFYGISVSGMKQMKSIMHMTFVDSKDLINGGAFGLEGGLGVTIVYAIGIVILLLTKTKQDEVIDQKS